MQARQQCEHSTWVDSLKLQKLLYVLGRDLFLNGKYEIKEWKKDQKEFLLRFGRLRRKIPSFLTARALRVRPSVFAR